MGKCYYVLSYKAEFDVDDIFEFRVSEFGMDAAIEYHFGLISYLCNLLNFPKKENREVK